MSTIHNHRQASRLVLFDNLEWEKVQCTDIDGFIDFGNKGMVIIEIKHKGAVPNLDRIVGQQLAIARITDALQKSGIKSIAVYGEYEGEYGDIYASECKVKLIRYNFKWCEIHKEYTVKQMIDGFLKKHLPEYLTNN